MSSASYQPNGSSYLQLLAASTPAAFTVPSATPTNKWVFTNGTDSPVLINLSSDTSAGFPWTPIITPGSSGLSNCIVVGVNDTQVITLPNTENSHGTTISQLRVTAVMTAGTTGGYLSVTPAL